MNNLLLAIALQIFAFSAFSQTKPSHIIYNSQGKEVSYAKMMKALGENDVVMFGELHDNPIAHWLEYEVTADLSKTKHLILGAEMFEADNQEPLNDYLSGIINYKGLDTLARLWPNNKTDYQPLVDFAKENKLAFIATNIPRRFASMVFKKGFSALDSLSDEEKTWVAPLPFPYDSELPRYKYILEMMGEHGTAELVMAQATKDATMAYFILKNMRKDQMFIHYNGAFHSDFHEGIVWYLKKSKPEIKVGTISTVSQDDIHKLEEEHIGRADFIICVDANMTSTY